MASPHVYQPQQAETAYNNKQQLGAEACYIAGGTWLQVQWEAERQTEKNRNGPSHLVSLERITEMRDIREEVHERDYHLQIGALTTLADCSRHALILHHFPLLAEASRHVASPSVRNRATLGGNIVIKTGDTLAALLTLDAEVTWYDGTKYKRYTIDEFLRNIEPTRDSPLSELLTSIHLQHLVHEERRVFVFRKVGRREAFVPALITVSAVCDENARHEIKHVRLAVGGGDFVPHRLMASESFLEGKMVSQTLLEGLHSKIMEEFHPPETLFATTQYRRLLAANLLVVELARAFDS